MNLLKVEDLTDEFIRKVIYQAGVYHRNIRHNQYFTEKRGKVLATLFFEPSTRTKLSFQSAMYKLSGNVIDLHSNSSMYKGENEEDTVKTLSQYSDVIVIRHSIPGRVEYLAQYSDVPVINGGDGSNEHPTQALIDLDTIEQYIHNKDEVKIMFTGDLYYSRTINSLIKLLKEDKYKFIVTNIVNEEIAENLKKRSLIRKSYISIEENQIPDMIDSVDVLYMTRNQTERQHRGILPSQFVLTNDLANKMAVDAIIMHPLPRNHEICPSVDKNIRAKYFNQVENGLYVRMALLNLMTK